MQFDEESLMRESLGCEVYPRTSISANILQYIYLIKVELNEKHTHHQTTLIDTHSAIYKTSRKNMCKLHKIQTTSVRLFWEVFCSSMTKDKEDFTKAVTKDAWAGFISYVVTHR